MLGHDWQDEYDALRRGLPFHPHTLGEYLTLFAGRTGIPVFAVAFGQSAPAVWTAITGALGLATPVARGAHAHAEPADLPPLDGEVVWADDERLAVRTADGLYTFHHGPTGMAAMFHHLFGPNTDGAEPAWQRWLGDMIA
ncbi:hypothetical protein [Nocardia acidivorans]|uniref:hypothetical protein n=1 Tax=Nocardia acidivorans TaxID=404580 RepID=UPI0008346604|nr:hypothetical protein [Nocardia acidivorans]